MTVSAIRQEIAAALDELPRLDAAKDELERHVDALNVALDGSTNDEARQGRLAAFQAMSGIARAKATQYRATQHATDYAHFI